MTDQSTPEQSGRCADDQLEEHSALPERYGQGQLPFGQAPYGQSHFGPAGRGQTSDGQPPYEQAAYGQAPYGQAPSGQAQYGQAWSGQAQYGQAWSGQAAYGQAWSGQAQCNQAPQGDAVSYAAPGEQPYYVPTAHQQAWAAAQHSQPYWTPPPVAPKPRHRRVLVGSLAAAVVTALAAGGVAVAVDRANGSTQQQTSLSSPNSQTGPFGQNGLPNLPGYGNDFGSSPDGSAGNGSEATPAAGTATAAQQVGVVDITTTLDYGQGKAAGTGIVLTSDGQILTNNHVIEDSTAITVTVVSTGKSYTARVVGTDPSDDISVLQLQDASGLATAKLGDSAKVAVGMAVTAVGNAGGTGGTPSAAVGTVTALNQSITASDANGSNAERLTGMIEVNADIQAGDSGGPLYSNASGTVIGIDTAASSTSARFGNGATTGFAIPIAKALSIADKIESGQASSTIHIGYPAFLGVELSPAQGAGATIGGVVSGSAAAKAGLAAGDTITAVDGRTIASASALSTVLDGHKPGDQVTLTYTDAAGRGHTVTVTLGEGPAD